MTNAEKTTILAEKVMKWRFMDGSWCEPLLQGAWKKIDGDFTPFKSNDWALRIADKLGEDWVIVMGNWYEGKDADNWYCQIGDKIEGGGTLREAICEAALKVIEGE